MTKPVRLQLQRRDGFRLQEWSRRTNGLPAVNVARPTKWGNPYHAFRPEHRARVVEMFRAHWADALANPDREPTQRALLAELRGKNLACWCKPGDPCHAGVLLELANR